MILTLKDFNILKESVSKSNLAIIGWGRMNPITNGHLENMKEVVKIANKEGGKAFMFLSHSTDSKKNPLTYKDKIRYAKMIAPSGLTIMESPAKTVFDVLKSVSSIGYKNIVLVCGEDRVEDFQKLEKYKEELKIDSYRVIKSGNRVPGVSGTQMREYVKNKDLESFLKGTPLPKKEATEMFNKVKEGLNL